MAFSSDVKTRDAVLWLWFPVVFFFGWMVFEHTAPAHMVAHSVAESGFIEILQVLVSGAACYLALKHALHINGSAYPWLRVWFLIAAAACAYITGEEVSWGQWIFLWQTPDGWMHFNDQGETNLHNVSSWLDQKPRVILEIGVIAGGLVLPWLLKYKPARFGAFLRSVIPSATLGVVSVIYIAIKMLDAYDENFGTQIFHRASEVIEFYLYYFVLLYMIAFDRTSAATDRRHIS